MPQLINYTGKPIDVVISIPTVTKSLNIKNIIANKIPVVTSFENKDDTIISVYSPFIGQNILSRTFMANEIKSVIKFCDVMTFNVVNPRQNNILGNTLQFVTIYNEFDVNITVLGNIVRPKTYIKYYGRDNIGIQRGTIVDAFISINNKYKFDDIVLTGNITDIVYGVISTCDSLNQYQKMFSISLTKKDLDC